MRHKTKRYSLRTMDSIEKNDPALLKKGKCKSKKKCRHIKMSAEEREGGYYSISKDCITEKNWI